MATQLQTRQDTFDLVAFKLIQQGGPATGDGGACRYRTPEGKKCAAGHLIPDAEYCPDQETKKASMVAGVYHYFGEGGNPCTISPTLAALAKDVDSAFLDYLQAAHDNAVVASLPHCTNDAWLAEWRDNMRALAERCRLDASILTWHEVVAE